ncbi:hypothetical protein NFHSH190041_37020 (plasmid) [Shewanella sp. NFH-SH190041]|uniref:DnaJ domain-containing protein n=1 Tax=Shewanella sp. NFH-SH190041 TaxID=2950245 RepID=UPI0021C3C26C|nr:DnaJ domain-containing protein [Shewanella sp. NFH-SH190041]BDM66250.1 hypothetical protein NFHSH190041_37020 [Shewanella sp. NFH-SH190041]
MKIIDALNILGLSGTVTKAEIKKAYKAASLKYHPDRNPAGKQMMQAINEAWTTLKELDQATAETEQTAGSYNWGEQLNSALNAVISLDGVDIEICGNWIWLSGDTRPHKEAIKCAGFKWAKNKKMWYFRPDDYQRKGRGNWSIDKIRKNHGSSKVKTQTRQAIAAH